MWCAVTLNLISFPFHWRRHQQAWYSNCRTIFNPCRIHSVHRVRPIAAD